MMRKIIILALALGFCLMSQSVLAINDWIMETDNHDATLAGTWSTSTARILYYGDDYRATQCSGNTGSVSATATFLARTTVDVTGNYSIYARWTIDPNRSTAAPYQIFKDDGDATPIATVTANQENHGGEWRYLGLFSFSRYDRPKVVLRNNCAAEANGAYVIADAIRWVKENISALDTVDEAGMDWNKNYSSVTIVSTSDTTPTQLISQTITCPAAGQVVASFTGELTYGGMALNNYANVLYSLSTSTAWATNSVQQISSKDVTFPDWMRAALAMQRIDYCSRGQSFTYRAFAHRGTTTDSDSYVWQPTLVLMYTPTIY